MEKATNFKNARIIALDAGTFVGTVERLILDLDSRTVAGILLEGGTRAIDGEEVQSLGEDAVTIRTANTIIELNVATELAECIKGEDEVYKKEVFTVAGKKIGFITDVLIESSSRSIVGFDMFSEFLFKDDVHGIVLLNDQVIFGRDLVLVPADVENLIASANVKMDYLTPPAQRIQRHQSNIETGLPKTPLYPNLNVADRAVSQPVEPQIQPAGIVGASSVGELQFPESEPADLNDSIPRAINFVENEPQFIDFSGVQAPRSDVIHGQQEVAPFDVPEERPDMLSLFQNFPIGNKGSAEEVNVSSDIDSMSPEQEKPFSLFPGEEITGGAFHVDSDSGSLSDSEVKPSPKDKLIGFVLGKTSSRDVVDVDGNVILETGATITDEVVAAAQAAELMPQVFLAASQGLHSRFKRRR